MLAEIPTPRIARITGSPAPINVPSMTNKTIAAIARPIISPIPRIPEMERVRSCENSMLMPGKSAAFRDATTDSRIGSSISAPGTVNCTVANATVPSLETVLKFALASRICLAKASSVFASSISVLPESTFTWAATSCSWPETKAARCFFISARPPEI
ncbi:unannotated protein [freshwater metagenome]|uniref:Unannotated protein n=1 Tax=freshwater metagenome TaxID=449393 RepID=A0A6J6K0B5_9ZZZZ